MNNWRQLFRMAVVALLCVGTVMSLSLSVGFAVDNDMTGCAVSSAMVVVFLVCANRMADMINNHNENENENGVNENENENHE